MPRITSAACFARCSASGSIRSVTKTLSASQSGARSPARAACETAMFCSAVRTDQWIVFPPASATWSK